MNKKLIAVLVAGMVAPMAAHADLKVYGKYNVGVASVNNGTDSGMAVTTDASRFGAKGSTDLGEGLSAIYKMEGEVKPDSPNTFSFGRDVYVGMKGGFGSLRVGHFNTAYKNATGKMDNFGDSVGDMTGSGFFSHFDKREKNTISYTLPKMGALKVAFDLHLTEEVDDTSTANDESAMGNSLSVAYNAGDMNLAVANTTRPGDIDESATKLGVGYKMGSTKLNFVYEMQDLGTVSPTVMNINATFNTSDKGSFGVSYSSADYDVADASATQLSLGYNHKLAKSTKARVVYTSIDNSDSTSADGRLFKGVNGALDNVAAGDDPSAIQFQVVHKF